VFASGSRRERAFTMPDRDPSPDPPAGKKPLSTSS